MRHSHLLLVDEIIVKAPDAVQVAIDRFGLQVSVQEIVDKRQDGPGTYMLDGSVQPQDKVLEGTHVISDGASGVILPFQEPTVVDERIGNAH